MAYATAVLNTSGTVHSVYGAGAPNGWAAVDSLPNVEVLLAVDVHYQRAKGTDSHKMLANAGFTPLTPPTSNPLYGNTKGGLVVWAKTSKKPPKYTEKAVDTRYVGYAMGACGCCGASVLTGFPETVTEIRFEGIIDTNIRSAKAYLIIILHGDERKRYAASMTKLKIPVALQTAHNDIYIWIRQVKGQAKDYYTAQEKEIAKALVGTEGVDRGSTWRGYAPDVLVEEISPGKKSA